jgi:Domain of unknown function (DUF222)
MIESYPHESGGMSATCDDSRAAAAVARFIAAVDDLLAQDLAALVRLDRPSAELLDAGAKVETARRRLQIFDAAYVSALETGDEPARNGCPSTAAFLRLQLRLSPGEAKRRVVAAQACSPREEFAVGVLPPHCPTLAAAQAAGVVSAEHTAVIIAALDKVPSRVPTEDVEAMEARLVAEAAVFGPGDVARIGRRILDHVDPDGTLRDSDWQQQTRSAALTRNHDGTGTLRAHLTTEALEILQTALEPLAKPVPTGEDGPDPRTPQQRLHDGLRDLGQRILDSGDLPASGGTPATVVLHMTAADYAARSGLATTDHGNVLPVDTALDIADQAVIYTVVTDAKDVPLELGRTSRLASPGQTIALAARDRGCSHPGCDRPPSWCQRHHVVGWRPGGRTDLGNLALLCGYHHRTFEQRGWTCVMVDGRPWWRPPTWVDPQRRLLRNTYFDPLGTSP